MATIPLAQQANDELQKQMMQREMATKVMPSGPLVPNRSRPMTPMSPVMAQAIGAAGDAASTYSFLKRGTGVEGNAMWKGEDNQPLATALPVAGAGVINLIGHALARKTGKTALARIADIITAIQGAHQLALAGQNVSHDYNGGFGPGSDSEREVNAMTLNAATKR